MYSVTKEGCYIKNQTTTTTTKEKETTEKQQQSTMKLTGKDHTNINTHKWELRFYTPKINCESTHCLSLSLSLSLPLSLFHPLSFSPSPSVSLSLSLSLSLSPSPSLSVYPMFSEMSILAWALSVMSDHTTPAQKKARTNTHTHTLPCFYPASMFASEVRGSDI